MSRPRFELPEGVWAVEYAQGLRLRGYEQAVAEAAERLRVLKDEAEGYSVRLGSWSLQVSEYVPAMRREKIVTMPGHAWNIAASVLRDAAYGEYRQNPFDFGEVGYLRPRPRPDIGVEVLIDPALAEIGPPYFRQCPRCLLNSPVSAQREEAAAWLDAHEPEHQLSEGRANNW
ncbi:MAG: hypothetical protein ACJ71T_02500 [Actinomycetales bacterium]